jgi:transcriptional regulator with GAF, ATPase, and Fis domain
LSNTPTKVIYSSIPVYNHSAAARHLGVTRQSLLRKMKRYGLDIANKRGH